MPLGVFLSQGLGCRPGPAYRPGHCLKSFWTYTAPVQVRPGLHSYFQRYYHVIASFFVGTHGRAFSEPHRAPMLKLVHMLSNEEYGDGRASGPDKDGRGRAQFCDIFKYGAGT